MLVHKILDRLVRKATRPASRSSARRARPQLESLESRMAPSDMTGTTPTIIPTGTANNSGLTGN